MCNIDKEKEHFFNTTGNYYKCKFDTNKVDLVMVTNSYSHKLQTCASVGYFGKL